MKCIRQATAQDADHINALRLSAYARATEFKVIKPSLLEWSKKDDEQIVLGAWNETGAAISTMRGGIVHDRHEAEEVLTCTVDIDTSLYPALALTKGATSLDQSNGGLNSALRYYFLQSSMESRVNSMIGLVYTNAARTRLMESLGYVFLNPEKIWDPADITIKPGLLAVLTRERFSSAINLLGNMAQQCLLEYPWAGPSLYIG